MVRLYYTLLLQVRGFDSILLADNRRASMILEFTPQIQETIPFSSILGLRSPEVEFVESQSWHHYLPTCISFVSSGFRLRNPLLYLPLARADSSLL
jgi:hypothetical protein